MTKDDLAPKPTPQTSRELIESPDVLDRLLRYVRARLKSTGSALGWNADEAEVVVQQTCVKVLRKEAVYRPERGGLAWLKAVANNIIRDRLRAHARRRERDGVSLEGFAEPAVAPIALDDGVLWDHVNELPCDQRALVWVLYALGVKPRDAVELLGLASPRAVHDLHHRAKKNLRRMLGKSALSPGRIGPGARPPG